MRPPPQFADPVDPTRVRTLPAPLRLGRSPPARSPPGAEPRGDRAALSSCTWPPTRHGLSFWADATIARKLRLREGDVIEARFRLVAQGLVAYRYPLYQLLPLADDRP